MSLTQAPVRFNDFTREPDELAKAMRSVVERVLHSGHYILGPEVEAFERDWAVHCDVIGAVGVGNGLDAIEIGLRALGVGTGDEVITTPMTAVASVLGIVRAGATPVLADIDPMTGLMSRESVERCISPSTSAVMPVHLYGQVRDMPSWSEMCGKAEVQLIEDCAQAHGAVEGGKAAGAWGAFGAYSFYPTKNLGALGDAGAVVTQSPEMAIRARSLRNYGQTDRYVHDVVGLNSRMDEVQAAILRARLPHLPSATARRREIAERYRTGIDNPHITLLKAPAEPENHVHHLFVVLTDHRQELQDHLASKGLESLIHYPVPVHLQGPFTQLQRDPAGLGHAESHGRRCLSLPCAPHLSDREVERVVDATNSFRI